MTLFPTNPALNTSPTPQATKLNPSKTSRDFATQLRAAFRKLSSIQIIHLIENSLSSFMQPHPCKQVRIDSWIEGAADLLMPMNLLGTRSTQI
jgi:hypothetical protein